MLIFIYIYQRINVFLPPHPKTLNIQRPASIKNKVTNPVADEKLPINAE